MKVVFAAAAIAQYRQIGSALKQHSPALAASFVESVKRMLRTISAFPRSGHIVPFYGKDTHFRFLVDSYHFYYTIRKGSVRIIAVIHAMRESAQVISLHGR